MCGVCAAYLCVGVVCVVCASVCVWCVCWVLVCGGGVCGVCECVCVWCVCIHINIVFLHNILRYQYVLDGCDRFRLKGSPN